MKYLVALAIILFPTGVANAENNPCGKGNCSGNQGDCRNTEAGANCEDNDFSPSFDKSPVQDSFNLVICLPMSTCNVNPPQGSQP
jgi:hypothetical protein